jgi:PAS domain-containing protein
VFERLHPDDVEIQQSKINKYSDFSKTFCTKFKHKNRHYVWLEDYIIPTFDKNGELIAVEGITRNIQERKELEKKQVTRC